VDNLRKSLTETLQKLAGEVSQGTVRGIFAVAIGDDGPMQVVYVEPEDRESLIIAVNEESNRVLGSPHQITSLRKLQDFLNLHGISVSDLPGFQAFWKAEDVGEP
jgi:hypothetical protein